MNNKVTKDNIEVGSRLRVIQQNKGAQLFGRILTIRSISEEAVVVYCDYNQRWALKWHSLDHLEFIPEFTIPDRDIVKDIFGL